MTQYNGPYHSWGDIKLNSAYPILEGYKDSVSVGVRLEFRNPLRFNGFDLSASFTPDPNLPAKERAHLGFNYHYWNWTLSATYDKFLSTRIGLRYNFTRRSLGAVDEEKGYRFHVFAETFINRKAGRGISDFFNP